MDGMVQIADLGEARNNDAMSKLVCSSCNFLAAKMWEEAGDAE